MQNIFSLIQRADVSPKEIAIALQKYRTQYGEDDVLVHQMRSTFCHTKAEMLAAVIFFSQKYGWDADPDFGVKLTVSKDNSKIGKAWSVNMPAGISCKGGSACRAWCYALAGYYQFASTEKPRFSNLLLWLTNPFSFGCQLADLMRCGHDIRINDSGDIPDVNFLNAVVVAAHIGNTVKSKCWKRGGNVRIMLFTKKYELVNEWLAKPGHKIPRNLRILFSQDPNIPMDNPYHLPETCVYDPDQETLPDDGFLCPGKCDTCRSKNIGCWNNGKRFRKIVFPIHSGNANQYKMLVAHQKEAA